MKESSKPFSIELPDGSRVSGIYKAARSMVIFSHGFDVQQDSNGLFTEIAGNLPENFGYLLFDYHIYSKNNEILRNITQQAEVLQVITNWAVKNLHPMSLHLIAHSLGCKIASLAKIDTFSSVIYLAPAMHHGSGFRRWLTSHPGAAKTDKGWMVSRKSGKTTIVSNDFFEQQEYLDSVDLLKTYSTIKPIDVIMALNDRFIPPQKYEVLSNIRAITLHTINGDHNFTEDSRDLVIHNINKLLTK